MNLDVVGNRIARKAACRAYKAAGETKAGARVKERAERRRKLDEFQAMVSAAFAGTVQPYHTVGYPAYRVWLPSIEVKQQR